MKFNTETRHSGDVYITKTIYVMLHVPDDLIPSHRNIDKLFQVNDDVFCV